MEDNNISNDEESIDFNEITKFLKRNVKFISLFSLISIVITSTSFINMKRFWSGQFQIVIEKVEKGPSQDDISNGSLALFSQIGDTSSSLKTEVEILKSPFVLLNIYSFIKDYDSFYKEEQIPFKDWSSQIKVEFVRGTSVLNITYKDQKKSNILPVLKKISEKYQDYSRSKRQKDIKSSINYFQNQIEIYKQKSILSNQKSNNFAIKHNLSFLRTNRPIRSSSNIDLLNIERARTDASTQINKIDKLIDKVTLNKNNPESITYLSEIIYKNFRTSGNKTSITKKIIDEINLKLIKLRNIYNENDDLITELKKRKEMLAQSLYKDTLGILYALKDNNNAIIESLERPEGVISKYKELIRAAAKDEMILSNLEGQLSFYSLEKARNKEPWQLITNPTLDLLPVPTYKLRKLILGFLAGLSLGAIYSFYREKEGNKIYTEKDLAKIFEGISIDIFKKSKRDNWEDELNIISIGLLGNYSGILKILLVDLQEDDDIRYMVEILNKNLNKLKIVITDSITDAFNSNEFILCSKSSTTSLDKLKQIKKGIMSQKKKIPTIIFIDT
ncbi:hypothetical protein OA972_00705 [Prochlorococcus sp. AH-716-B03]|nr:hypothetical protein [Prochlorococcus sp. AH-716-B03]